MEIRKMGQTRTPGHDVFTNTDNFCRPALLINRMLFEFVIVHKELQNQYILLLIFPF
jgi:hypothetical protein